MAKSEISGHPEAALAADITLRHATLADLPRVVGLLEDSLRWLAERGLPAWPPGFIQANERLVRREVEQGLTVVAERGSTLLGTVTLAWDDDEVWGAQSAEGGYVVSLATRRDPAARGLGAQLLGFCERETLQHGRRFLRLTAAAQNEKLLQYYGGMGFQPAGHFLHPEGLLLVRLEKALGKREIGDRKSPSTE